MFKSRSPIRYSLLVVFGAVMFLCCLLAVVGSRAREQAKLAKQISQVGGQVQFSDGSFFGPDFNASHHWVLSATRVKLLPNNFFPADDQIQLVAKLPAIKHLTIGLGSTIKNQTLFEGTGAGAITDLGLAQVAEQLGHLSSANIAVGSCSHKAVESFATKFAHSEIKQSRFGFKYDHVIIKN